jgi:hypothetical protein
MLVFIHLLTSQNFILLCRYEYFYGLLRDFPDLRLTINGGINCVDEVSHCQTNWFFVLLIYAWMSKIVIMNCACKHMHNYIQCNVFRYICT